MVVLSGEFRKVMLVQAGFENVNIFFRYNFSGKYIILLAIVKYCLLILSRYSFKEKIFLLSLIYTV